MDVTDARDAVMMAQAQTQQLVAEVLREWNRPDQEMMLALRLMTAPPEALDLLDDRTKRGIKEVFNAR